MEQELQCLGLIQTAIQKEFQMWLTAPSTEWHKFFLSLPSWKRTLTVLLSTVNTSWTFF